MAHPYSEPPAEFVADSLSVPSAELMADSHSEPSAVAIASRVQQCHGQELPCLSG